MRAVTPDPSSRSKLLSFLRAYRDWAQYVVDEIWSLNYMKELHRRFYKLLRELGEELQGFRAHHCHKNRA